MTTKKQEKELTPIQKRRITNLCKKDKTEIAKTVVNLESEFNDLRNKYNNSNINHNRIINTLHNRIDSLSTENKNLNERLNDEHHDYDTLDKKVESLEKDITFYKEEIRKDEEQMKVLQNKVDQYKDIIAKNNISFKNNKDNITTLKNDLAECTKDNDYLRSIIAKKDTEITKLIDKVRAKENQEEHNIRRLTNKVNKYKLIAVIACIVGFMIGILI